MRLYLHQWMNATTRLKSSMKRFDNFKWCSTQQASLSGLAFRICHHTPARAVALECINLIISRFHHFVWANKEDTEKGF